MDQIHKSMEEIRGIAWYKTKTAELRRVKVEMMEMHPAGVARLNRNFEKAKAAIKLASEMIQFYLEFSKPMPRDYIGASPGFISTENQSIIYENGEALLCKKIGYGQHKPVRSFVSNEDILRDFYIKNASDLTYKGKRILFNNHTRNIN